MSRWIRVAVAASAVGCVATLLLVFLWRWCHRRRHRNFVEPTRVENVQGGIEEGFELDQGNKNSKGSYNNYYVFRGSVSGKRGLFNWGDHPSMAADAVENGWSRFAFTGYKSYTPSPSKRSTLLGVCAAPGNDSGRERERESGAEISWEVSRGSAEFMQKVRLNPGIKNSQQNHNLSMNVASIIRGALPLPGPPLGHCAFPQEAYFEITILYSRGDEGESVSGKSKEGEKTKLLVQVNNVEGEGGNGNGKGQSVMFSLGLTALGSVPLRFPGSYPGSIGFNSNGSLYLDGKCNY
uniref:Uncharacterized protein n=1 Tax=Cajanus cajan TaxID=3821 RepID=A0A151RIB9_CAJCA|nr:hypothetical protein KK1_036301 [Cajanus cajan]